MERSSSWAASVERFGHGAARECRPRQHNGRQLSSSGPVTHRWHRPKTTAQCGEHGNLAHYRCSTWLVDGPWRVNPFIHDSAVPSDQARLLSRLLAGGQGLRVGDPVSTRATRTNCCVLCLEQGVKQAECPAYDTIRNEHSFQEMAEVRAASTRSKTCRHGGK